MLRDGPRTGDQHRRGGRINGDVVVKLGARGRHIVVNLGGERNRGGGNVIAKLARRRGRRGGDGIVEHVARLKQHVVLEFLNKLLVRPERHVILKLLNCFVVWLNQHVFLELLDKLVRLQLQRGALRQSGPVLFRWPHLHRRCELLPKYPRAFDNVFLHGV
jgi:hypothetical protein